MLNLTAPIAVKNIQKIECSKFDLGVTEGTVTLTIYSAGSPPCQKTFRFGVTDTVNGSNGLAVSANPQSWDETVTVVTGVGVVNSYTNAVAAYNGAAGGKQAKLDAVLARGVTDGWLTSAFAGS